MKNREKPFILLQIKMKIIWEDWKKHWVFTKIDTTWMPYERVVELYQWLQDDMEHLLVKQSEMKQKMKDNNRLVEEFKRQLNMERKELKEEIWKEIRAKQQRREEKRESKEERDKRLKEAFMKLL